MLIGQSQRTLKCQPHQILLQRALQVTDFSSRQCNCRQLRTNIAIGSVAILSLPRALRSKRGLHVSTSLSAFNSAYVQKASSLFKARARCFTTLTL